MDSGETVLEKRARHFAHFCSLMPDQIERLSWSRDRIGAYQRLALQWMLGHAKRHSAWHRSRLAHIDERTITLADLVYLPTMTKSILMDNWDDSVTVRGACLRDAEASIRTMTDQSYIWGDHVLFASGGTGGRPGIFLYDWDGLALNWAGMARSIRHYVESLPLPRRKPPRPYRTAAIGAEISAHGSFVVGKVFSNPANPTHRFSGWRSVDQLIPQLNEVMPDLLCAYPSLMPALVAAARAGELRMRPRMIVCGGEHFPEESQALARQAWPDADILSCWGTSEAGGTFPCPLGDGFHVSEDQVIIEPVDAHGAPVLPGEKSAGIYLTNLYNKAQPIIRYYIDDVFEFDDKPCACGCAYLKVRQVHGRNFEKFQYGNITVHPVTLQLAVLEQPNILEYQFVQTPKGAQLVFRSQGEIDERRLQLRMQQALQSYGLEAPEITLANVTALERTAAGKLRRFVPIER